MQEYMRLVRFVIEKYSDYESVEVISNYEGLH